jgi:N-methylhydantoinase A/oxoprolinase/acetone carboxylase beta subunit
MQKTPVYDGLALAAGVSLDGPAIAELANTTIVVRDGFHLSVDRLGAFVVAENTRGRELAAGIVEAGWTA